MVATAPWARQGADWVRTLCLALVPVLASASFARDFRTAMAHYGAGLQLVDLDRYGEAAREFGLALEADPGWAEARYQLAVALFRQHEYAQAEEQFEQLLPSGHQTAWVTYYLGRLDLLNGRVDSAIRRLESVKGAQPLYDELYYLGSAYSKKGETKKAVNKLREQLAFNPRDARAHYLLGEMLARMGLDRDAHAQFGASQRIHRYYSQGKQDLDACHRQLQAGNETAAWARCGAPALRLNDIDRLVAVGMLFGEFHYYQRALQVLKAGLALDPKLPEVNYDLAYTYYQMGDYAKAAQYSQVSIEQQPYFFQALEVDGLALYRQGRNNAARPVLERARQLRPDDPVVSNTLAEMSSNSRH